MLFAKTRYRRRRRKVINELRSGRHKHQKKAIGAFLVPDAPVCFLGVVARTFPGKVVYRGIVSGTMVADWLGIEYHDFYQMIDLNDASENFDSVANYLETIR